MKLVLVQPELHYREGADNYGVVKRLCDPLAGTLAAEDVVLLPEHFDLRPSRAEYENGITELARTLGCHVVGGSHHESRVGSHVNAGIVVNGGGERVAVYEKLRPYAEERARVREGTAFGEFVVDGHTVLVLVCADFWFSDLLYRASVAPELILVPALSVSRKATPHYSRSLWQHLSIARAYEFGAYVGVSDWAHAPTPGHLTASGVAGFADPTTEEAGSLYRAVEGNLAVIDVDFERLANFRSDRMARGFFWKRPG